MSAKNSQPGRVSRREFLSTAAAVVAFPTIIPASALGGAGRPAPSERITVGIVGWGMQGPPNTRALLNEKDCQVVAACDVHKGRLQAAVDTINRHYGNKDCKAYTDYREMFARKDIDAVMLAVPDNWHGVMSVEAARQGKDIYGEKPLARTLAEQQAIVRAVQRHRRIWQTGSWQRSERNFRYACEIVRNGLIGKIRRVEVGLPAGHHDFAGTLKAFQQRMASVPGAPRHPAEVVEGTEAWKAAVSDPPAELDWDMWLGPSQMEPYIEVRVHMNWRWNYNVGGGQLLDWIGHHCDIAHWGLGNDDRIGPLEIEGVGEFPPAKAIWNTCTRYRLVAKYPGDIEVVIAGGHADIRSGTKWIGTDGWVWVDRGNAFDSSNPEWNDRRTLPEDVRKVKLYESPGHFRNFLDCIKTRQPTITPVEVAHRSAIPGHLGLIALLLGRKIRWDPNREQILGDSEATKLMRRELRAPWKLT